MQTPELWLHQKLAIEKAKTCSDLCLFFDPGLGKTRTTLEILRHVYNTHRTIYRTLIIAPKSVVTNWQREFIKYTKIPPEKVHVLKGTVAQKAKFYLENEGIFVTNFDALAFAPMDTTLIKNPPNILVVDESHRAKNSTSKRTKVLSKVSLAMSKLPVKHRYLLTGTPVLNSEIDLYSQFVILHQAKAFGALNFYAFRATYFQDKNAYMPKKSHFPCWVPRKGAREKLKALIEPYVITAKKEECLDLPPLIYKEIDVELSPKQRQAYESMKKDFIAFTEKGAAVAQLAITKALRLQQILSGFLILEDGTINVFKDNNRAEVLADLMADIVPFEKIIVWSIFKQDYVTIRKICADLKIKYAEVTGEVSDKQKELDMFEQDPECRVMIASQAAGGVGVNMIAASTMIYYSKGYSLEHDLQSEARNYRGGSEIHKKITRIDLVARGTVDEIVNKALKDKSDLAKDITQLRNLLIRN